MTDKLLLDLARLTDTHARLRLGEELSEYFSKDGCKAQGFLNFGNLVGGLAHWLNASSLQVNLMAMKVLSIIVAQMKRDFQVYLNTIFDPVVNRLGDAKVRNRQSAHSLLLQLLEDCTDNPQVLLDRMLDTCLLHKNWQMKHQGLAFLIRALDHFGVKQIECRKYVGLISKMTVDSNSKVRKASVCGLVDMYSMAGQQLRDELAQCDIPAAKLKMLTDKFNSADSSRHSRNHTSRLQEYLEKQNDTGKISTCSSSLQTSSSEVSSKQFNSKFTANKHTKSHPSSGKYRSHSLARSGSKCNSISVSTYEATTESISVGAAHKTKSTRAPSIRGSTPTTFHRPATRSSSPGTMQEEDFESVFNDVKEEQLLNTRELENKLYDISENLKRTELNWEIRLNSLKKIRGIFCSSQKIKNKDFFGTVLRVLEDCLIISLKDLRSHFMRETCITISYICRVLQHNATTFGGEMMVALIPHLSNSVRIIATSAEVCITYIIKYSPSSILLFHLSAIGFPSKSSIIRSYSAKFFHMILTLYDAKQLYKQVQLVENILELSIRDADPTTRKYGRQSFWKYYAHFTSNAERLLENFNKEERKYIDLEKPFNSMNISTSTAGNLTPLKPYTNYKVPVNKEKVKCATWSKPESDQNSDIFTGTLFQSKRPQIQIGKSQECSALDAAKENEFLLSPNTQCQFDLPCRHFTPQRLEHSQSNSRTDFLLSTSRMSAESSMYSLPTTLGQDESPSNSLKCSRESTQSVDIQTHLQGRSIGVQKEIKEKDVAVQHQCRAEDKQVQMDACPMEMEFGGKTIIQLNVNDLENFIEKTVEKMLAKRAKRKSALDQIRSMLETHIGRILCKLDNTPGGSTNNEQSGLKEASVSHAGIHVLPIDVQSTAPSCSPTQVLPLQSSHNGVRYSPLPPTLLHEPERLSNALQQNVLPEMVSKSSLQLIPLSSSLNSICYSPSPLPPTLSNETEPVSYALQQNARPEYVLKSSSQLILLSSSHNSICYSSPLPPSLSIEAEPLDDAAPPECVLNSCSGIDSMNMSDLTPPPPSPNLSWASLDAAPMAPPVRFLNTPTPTRYASSEMLTSTESQSQLPPSKNEIKMTDSQVVSNLLEAQVHSYDCVSLVASPTSHELSMTQCHSAKT